MDFIIRFGDFYMNLYGYEFERESDLTHHGIKGQKWGVRRYQNEDGTWTAAGKQRYGVDSSGNRHYSRMFQSKDTYDRIKSIRDSDRYDYLSTRQKKSLAKAEQYWKARSEGKTPTVKRGIIKRNSDRYRSYSGGARYGHSVAMGILGSVGSMKMAIAFGQSPVVAAGSAAAGAAIGAVGGMLWSDFIHGKAFGHF